MGKILQWFIGKGAVGTIVMVVVLLIFSMGVIKVYDLFKVNKLEKNLIKKEAEIIRLVKLDSTNTAALADLSAQVDTCNTLYSNMESKFQTQIKSLTNRTLYAERKYNEVKDGGCNVITFKGWPNRGEIESNKWVTPCPYLKPL